VRPATQAQLDHAAKVRESRSQLTLQHARHICDTHRKTPPQLPEPTAVRNRYPNARMPVHTCGTQSKAVLEAHTLGCLFLREYRRVQ